MSDCNCVFRTPVPIEFDITLSRDAVVADVVSTLNKIGEARYDGENAKYVNNLQPEVDFEQDRDLVNSYFAEAVANIVRRIEPYISSHEADADGAHGFHMSMPQNWRSTEQDALETKIKAYARTYIISQWLEKVSMQDEAYTLDKARWLLRDIKGICELRAGKVHRSWNTPY